MAILRCRPKSSFASAGRDNPEKPHQGSNAQNKEFRASCLRPLQRKPRCHPGGGFLQNAARVRAHASCAADIHRRPGCTESHRPIVHTCQVCVRRPESNAQAQTVLHNQPKTAEARNPSKQCKTCPKTGQRRPKTPKSFRAMQKLPQNTKSDPPGHGWPTLGPIWSAWDKMAPK